ncbi:MAG: site-2 protease family protein [Defluviitaleaceae bacterium]|nr:site-2 protease family protein [Defluviitaleaceae bacterium]
MSIILAILVFGLVVLVHEVGHFVAARRCGIWVEEFAIGMGPKLFAVQRGETLYSIRAIPLGGFCMMHGDAADALANRSGDSDIEDTADEPIEYFPDRALNRKPIPQRIAVMFAGSFMNFVLAFIIFTLLVGAFGFRNTTLDFIVPDSPAEAGGLTVGDRITSLNGSRVLLWDDIQFAVDTSDGSPIVFGFIRDGQYHHANIAPMRTRVGDDYFYRIGIAPERRVGLFTNPIPGVERATIGEVVAVGFLRIGFFVRMVVTTLFNLVTGQVTMAQLGFAGPVGIVGMIGGEYQATVAAAAEVEASRMQVIFAIIVSMLSFAALISANLGIFNLLPLPALDGGRIFFLLLEAIRRKPIPVEKEGMVHFAGFVLLMVLLVFITYQDILNLIRP